MTVHVAIRSNDPEAARRLCHRLAGPGLSVCPLDANATETQAHVIVVLTEGAAEDVPQLGTATPGPDRQESARPADTRETPQTGSAEGEPDAPAVVWLGRKPCLAGPLEVHLPADVGPELLGIVCRLLGRIVQLERRWRLEAQSRVRLAAQAMRDPLTGLPNRRAWDSVLARRLPQADAARRLCLAIFDLDHFKQVNDTRGHPAGDQLLRTAGQTLVGQLRRDDFVARLGGDEFGLLLWVPDQSTAAQVIERVRRALPEGLVQAGLDRVTASAGYCVVPYAQPAQQSVSAAALLSAEALYEAADQAMRLAKQQGRDRSLAAPCGTRARGEPGT